MKRLLSIFLLIFLTSCTVAFHRTPYGIWHNEEHNITIFISPDYFIHPGHYPGILIGNGKEIDIIVNICRSHGMFFIANASLEERITLSNSYFDGFYRVRHGRLEYTLTSHHRELTGIDRIVFELIEEVVLE